MDIDKYFALLKKINVLFNPNNPLWKDAKTKVIYQNHWLTDDFLDLKIKLINNSFFSQKNFSDVELYFSKKDKYHPTQTIAFVIEDNIILSGFYELLFAVGLGATIEIKCLPYQQTLLQPIVQILNHKKERIFFVERISKNCSRYIFYKKEKLSPTAITYFEKYPHTIHTPKKGVAIIEGNETAEKLQLLAKHIFSFWGMENTNITKIWVPQKYDMNLLFENFKLYFPLKNHTHYSLQYDYHLATIILQKKLYFTNGLITIVENEEIASPISILNFEYYTQTPNSSISNEGVGYTIKVNNLEENTMQELENKNRVITLL